MSDEPKDYEVGYAKPPKDTQFQKGKSGNPKGRPKKSLNLLTRFWKLATKSVLVKEGNKQVRMEMIDVGLLQMMRQATGGDLSAMKELNRLALLELPDQTANEGIIDANTRHKLMRCFIERFRAIEPGPAETQADNKGQSMSSPTDADIRVLAQNDLLSFVQLVFGFLYPQTEFVNSPHLALLAAWLERCERGDCKRLIICLPPRSLKSLIASVAFVAWVLGKNPHKQIICASYAQDLADKHARDTRAVMVSDPYKYIFSTRLSPQRTAVSDFNTTANGFRMAASVNGVLTGRGGDMLIIDDPMKPADAQSDTQRKGTNDWYDSTLLSRLNSKKDGVIIVIMQRLHQDDLAGHLLEKGSWEILKLPAIADADEVLSVNTPFSPVTFRRKEGDALDFRREPVEVLKQLRAAMGEYAFSAQYQQNPQPPGGAIIKTKWLRYYKPMDLPQQFAWKLQSWDTASKSGELNDYSVCTTWGVLNNHYYLLDVLRKRLEYPGLRRIAKEEYRRYRPRTVLIEDKGSGIQLLQDLRAESIPITAYSPPPGHDKQMRASNQSAQFESGRVLLPHGAPWVGDFVRELTTFPGAKYDDQMDSTTQAVDYLSKMSMHSCSISELLI